MEKSEREFISMPISKLYKEGGDDAVLEYIIKAGYPFVSGTKSKERIASLTDQLYGKSNCRQWEYEQDYLDYEDDRRD